MTTNFRAMQAAGAAKMKKKSGPFPEPPKDVNIGAMAGGSFRANLSKGGIFHKKSSGAAKKRSGPTRVTTYNPPIEGWNDNNLGKSYRTK